MTYKELKKKWTAEEKLRIDELICNEFRGELLSSSINAKISNPNAEFATRVTKVINVSGYARPIGTKLTAEELFPKAFGK